MKNEKGFSLLETVIGIAILAVVGIGIVSGLGTTFKMLSITDDRQQAKTLAEAQMEYVQGSSYDSTFPYEYPLYGTSPTGYTITTTPEAIPWADATSIQKITVTVDHPFGQITLIDYKVNVNR